MLTRFIVLIGFRIWSIVFRYRIVVGPPTAPGNARSKLNRVRPRKSCMLIIFEAFSHRLKSLHRCYRRFQKARISNNIREDLLDTGDGGLDGIPGSESRRAFLLRVESGVANPLEGFTSSWIGGLFWLFARLKGLAGGYSFVDDDPANPGKRFGS